MSDVVQEFFEELGRRGHEPLLQKATATIRFDLAGDRVEHWLVKIEKGDVAVSRRNGRADCVVRADRAVLEDILRGEANAFASMLRGAATVEGSFGLLAMFQRLFPGPPDARGSREAAGYAQRLS